MTLSSKQIVAVALALVVLACVGPMPFGWAQHPDGQGDALPEDYSCVVCHRKDGPLWTDTTPVVDAQLLAHDIHWQKGLRCHDCHGGSPTLDAFKNHRDDPTFHPVSPRNMIPDFCGRCHSNIDYMRQYNPSARTDQEKEYWTSGHGQRLRESAKGANPHIDTAVATCVDCHGHHGILAVKNTESPVYRKRVAETCARCHADEKLMAGRTYRGRPLGHDQYAKWQQSVHGQGLLKRDDLSAATCNDCHGNHGALPPGISSVANACGTCHGRNAKLFAATKMKHKFEDVGLPGCVTCHGQHDISIPTDKMLGMVDGAVCSHCHNAEHPQYGATVAGGEAAIQMRRGLDQLREQITLARTNIREAERLGMQVRGPRFDLRQAFDALTNARALVHGFDPGPVQVALNQGLKVTASVNSAAEAALREHTRRRIWLACSLVPILVVVGLLLACIRQLPAPTTSS